MLAQAFHISPLEVYAMPMPMVKDYLLIHSEVEKYKGEEMDRLKRQV